jgi:uncharacterized protein (TIGR02302 family)
MKRYIRGEFNRVAFLSAIALAALWIEAIGVAFWRMFALAGAFLVIALMGIPSALPAALHILLLSLVVAALVWLGWKGKRRLIPPTRAAALRRLELDSDLRHRPFETLTDRPAGNSSPAVLSIWRLHQARKRADVKNLQVPFPHPQLPEHDPEALRLLVLIAAIVLLIIAGPRAGHLIAASILPSLNIGDSKVPVEAWIKPPAYTGLAPILLKPDLKAEIAVPIGSTLEAQITGASRAPNLTLGQQRETFRESDPGNFSLSYKLSTSGTLKIARGWSTLGSWNIGIIPDHPPEVSFTDKPAGVESGALKIAYSAKDDYGVAAVDMHIRFAGEQKNIVADPIALPLVSGQNEKDLTGNSYQDITAHPWAGMKVAAKLIATDTAGQTSESQEIQFILPERSFSNPVALEIIAARKHIILNDTPHFQLLSQISRLIFQPELYGGDFSVFLALRAAMAELSHPPAQDVQKEEQNIADIEDLLWNAALKIDGGDRLEAEQALRAAEDALEKALKDPATPSSEMARLTKNLKNALNRHLNAMAADLQKKIMRGGQMTPPDPNSELLDRSDLENQIDQMNDMAQTGSREDAEKMLSSLKDMLENMRTGENSANANPAGRKALEELKDLAQKQRALERNNDKDVAEEKSSGKKASEPQKNTGSSGTPSGAEEQEALRKSLGDAARDVGEAMGNIPKSLSQADKAMRGAARSLQGGNKGDAEAQQEDAASQLDEAAKSIGAQMSKDRSMAVSGNGKGSGDPLGRGGPNNPASFNVPKTREMQRSRAILDELRKRSSEHARPRPELDYIQRLLQ